MVTAFLAAPHLRSGCPAVLPGEGRRAGALAGGRFAPILGEAGESKEGGPGREDGVQLRLIPPGGSELPSASLSHAV